MKRHCSPAASLAALLSLALTACAYGPVKTDTAGAPAPARPLGVATGRPAPTPDVPCVTRKDDVTAPGVGNNDAVDMNGDQRNDLAVLRPSTAHYYWSTDIMDPEPVSPLQPTLAGTVWGTAGDIMTPNDFDCDDRTDLAVYRPTTGTWYILPSSMQRGADQVYVQVPFGGPDDIPAVEDFDGDKKYDLALWNKRTGEWQIHYRDGRVEQPFKLGGPGDIPVAFRYDADACADPAVFSPASATWTILESAGGGRAACASTAERGIDAWPRRVEQVGTPGSEPHPYSYVADAYNTVELATFDPKTAIWTIQVGGPGSRPVRVPFGEPGDRAAPAFYFSPYSEDRAADLVVFNPCTGVWHLRNDWNGTQELWKAFGVGEDIPIYTRELPAAGTTIPTHCPSR